VVCHDAPGLKHSVSAIDGVLSIKLTDTRKWYEYISFSFDNTEVSVYIPAEEYGTLDIDISTGDVDIPNNFKSNDKTSTEDERFNPPKDTNDIGNSLTSV
jgi:hypothetical protein